jgi:HAMP domain-containing protein
LSTRWILDLASLGLSSYKNGVYEQVAADNQSRAAIETLYVVTLVYFIIFLVIMQYLFGRLANLRNRSQRLFGGLSSASEPAPTPDGMRKELETILKSLRRMRLVLYFYAMFMGVVFVNHFVAQARLSYISSADAHYHQVMREAAPYLDAREQAGVESEFAQIGSREDYVRLLSRLEGQCKAHGKTVPKFDPW